MQSHQIASFQRENDTENHRLLTRSKFTNRVLKKVAFPSLRRLGVRPSQTETDSGNESRKQKMRVPWGKRAGLRA
jgi:hypothetical protein